MSLISIWNWIMANIISLLAFLLAGWVWFKQGRYEGKLAKLQLDKFNRIELFLELIMREEKKSPILKITNIGDVEAYNVELEYGSEIPIREGEYNSIFPITKFSPNTPISLLFQITEASPSSFDITIKWKNKSEKGFSKTVTLYRN